MFTSGAAFVLCAAMAAAQSPPAQNPPQSPARVSRFGIPDNSFLIEEAFNQEKGIVQNTVVFQRSKSGNWDTGFTQEWPIGGERHQFAFAIPYASVTSGDVHYDHIGDIDLSYRLKVSGGEVGTLAFTPELSLIVPTGKDTGPAGWAASLPFSKEIDRLFLHLNVGNEWRDGTTPFIAGSAVIAVRPMFNLMLESSTEWAPGDAGRERSTTISPGVRFGWNKGDAQIVLGVGAPITRGAVRDHGILLYFSYELPFSKNR
jgi:hypothetical protein